MQRWQLTFSRGVALQYVGHLDLTRAWERVLRRAHLKMSYSIGFHPHAKMAFASPLPTGVLGREELLDVTLEETLTSDELRARIAAQLPEGLELTIAAGLRGKPLPARLRGAMYRAGVATELDREEVESRIRRALEATTLPRTRKREKDVRHYDLRPLLEDLWIERWDGEHVVGMRLKVDSTGAGRADEVLSALGLGDGQQWIERTSLILDDQPEEAG